MLATDQQQPPFFFIPPPQIPNEEQMRADRQRCYDWTTLRLIEPSDILTRGDAERAAQINLLSLPAWLAVAQRAGVDIIPARLLADMDAETYLETFDHHEGFASDAFDAFHARIIDRLNAGEMVRMEQVAPRDIKAILSEGGEMISGIVDLGNDQGLRLELHEDRFYDTLRDLGADRVRAFGRPIVQPVMIDGILDGTEGRWPAEFRVFIEDDQIVGISNYYPQVSMDPQRFAPAAALARDAAQAILDTMEKLHLGVGNHALCPDLGPTDRMVQRPDWKPDHWGAQSFTLDFMLLEDGRVVLLEGGPAGLSAAHPCCFLQPGRPMEPDFLHGVAWSTETPITQLSELP